MADDNICGKCGTRVDLIADEFGDWRSVVPLIAGKRYHNDCVYDMVANYDRLHAENQRLRELLHQSRPWLQEDCDELEGEEDNGRADTYDVRMELETLLARIQQAIDARPPQEDRGVPILGEVRDGKVSWIGVDVPPG